MQRFPKSSSHSLAVTPPLVKVESLEATSLESEFTSVESGLVESVGRQELESVESLAIQFFQESAGRWHSERRYYTLNSGLIQEVVSELSVEFLEADNQILLELAQLHGLGTTELCAGVQIRWDSQYQGPSAKTVTGSTVFGLQGDVLYRDRGFATSKPVTGLCHFPRPRTMVLRTEYDGSAFEEEVKLISDRYRTRQTIISRAGMEQMIGQYLERRIA